MIHYNVNYVLEPAGKGKCTLTCRVSVKAEGKAFAFAHPVLKTLAQRELQTDLSALKIAVEQKIEKL